MFVEGPTVDMEVECKTLALKEHTVADMCQYSFKNM